MHVDPDAPAEPGSSIFGLIEDRKRAQIVLIPVAFDATVSYGHGCARGPEAIVRASKQVDLLDPVFGRVWERGIVMEQAYAQIRVLNEGARSLAQPMIKRGGAQEGDAALVREVDALCSQMNRIVRARVCAAIHEGKRPGVIGGEHSVAYGAIVETAERYEGVGVLQIDAHMDLRKAYEGLAWSHASVMFNVLRDAPGVKNLVQVGVRDFGERERAMVRTSEGRIVCHLDHDLFVRRDAGESWRSLCKQIIAHLPERVWISFDIDGLEPALCPHTGTPVPGGLGYNEARLLLHTLAQSGREVVGFDLVEVCPGDDARDEWDANVGARIAYSLCGCVSACNAPVAP